MKKGITIFLGVMVGALMLTSFISAVNSEIIMAKKAALVVTSHPVIATDRTLAELEPEKYDSMIDAFRANTMKDGAAAAENIAMTAEDPDEQQALPVSSETTEAEPDTPAHRADNGRADENSDILSFTMSPTNGDPAVPADSERDDTTAERDSGPRAEGPEKSSADEKPSEQNASVPLYADAGVDHDKPAVTESPVSADDHTVYTIQAASFSDLFNAEKKYDSLVQTMAAADLHKLRIEKVGPYYTVRLGRFDHYVTAMKFLNSMHEKLSSAIVLDAYIKNERIVQLYNHAMLAGK